MGEGADTLGRVLTGAVSIVVFRVWLSPFHIVISGLSENEAAGAHL